MPQQITETNNLCLLSHKGVIEQHLKILTVENTASPGNEEMRIWRIKNYTHNTYPKQFTSAPATLVSTENHPTATMAPDTSN